MAASTRPPSRPQPLPVQRDGLLDGRSRNKENVPSPSSTKSDLNGRRRSFIPSLVQPSDKSDFFTDSYLADNNASQTSLIPSPLPKTTALSKPRRSLRPLKTAEDHHRKPKHRSTRSDLSNAAVPRSPASSHKSSARETSPVRSIGLSTPPRSRDGSFTESPLEAQFSSPPRALTETYERIDQEEDLAATEGQISDPDSEPPPPNDAQMSNGHGPSKQTLVNPSRSKPRSRGSTPTNSRFPDLGQRARNDDLTTASVLSDPTGMSFVNQLSDQNLAYALTPHMLQSAADKEALRKVWDTKRPIAFGKAKIFALSDREIDQAVETSPQPAPHRLIAFSKAGKRRLASDFELRPHHQRTFSDVTDRLDHNAQEDKQTSKGDEWHNDDLRRGTLPLNPRIHRAPYFPRTHGFPERQALTELNGGLKPHRKARSESPFARPPRTADARQGDPYRSSNANIPIASQPVSNLSPSYSGSDLIQEGQGVTKASSDLDWMQAAADDPVESIESTHPRRSKSRLSNAGDIDTSPEKSRRFDIDFTGQSFQVSESPPVRTKSLAQDFSREREIQGLAKRAVTTSRLSQLRARESLDRLRQSSRSPVSEVSEPQKESDENDLGSRTDGEQLVGTPVVVYRSKSNSIGRTVSGTPPLRPSADRSQSHDLLQRLARGSSSTPRSSTPSENAANDLVESEKPRSNDPDVLTGTDQQEDDEDTLPGTGTPSADAVKATPKVSGAWTDTILPDTVRTAKQTGQRVAYAQTPHVSAGGWIDTPVPVAQPSRLEPVPELTQEIPEELMNGIAKDTASSGSRTILATEPAAKHVTSVPSSLAPSLAKKVLAEAKDSSSASNLYHNTNSADGSLVLGNATIQSLENVLDMDETDMSILSRIGEESLGQTDTEVLDRLGSKLDRLRTHIHDARKGISKLESQISLPDQPTAPIPQPTPCDTCGQLTIPLVPHIHTPKSSTYFPLTLLTLSIPVPLLFRPPLPTSTRRLPRPTPFGWAVLGFWTWYLVECTLAEIYSHPQYASHYTWPVQQEPDFPFVLPTMLWRWSRMRWVYPHLLQPAMTVVIGLFRMLGMWCGIIDGFVDGSVNTAAGSAMKTVYQQAQAGIGDGLDMMNDEFL